VNASERIAIGDPVSRRFTLTATGHLNDSEVIQELTTCVVLYVLLVTVHLPQLHVPGFGTVFLKMSRLRHLY